jgi:hypothetical protein
MGSRHGSHLSSRSGARGASSGKRSGPTQCLCLSKEEADRLAVLANKLGAKGATIARGLGLLGLRLALGDLDQLTAVAFRVAAGDPTPEGLRDSLDEVVELFPSDMLGHSDVQAPRQRTRSRRGDRRKLVQQGLRLPEREELLALTASLRADGILACPAHVIRGLFLLAFDIATGALGAELAAIFCRAAIASSSEGAREAVEALRTLRQGEPSTTPTPPPSECTPSTRSRDSDVPPTLPARWS